MRRFLCLIGLHDYETPLGVEVPAKQYGYRGVALLWECRHCPDARLMRYVDFPIEVR